MKSYVLLSLFLLPASGLFAQVNITSLSLKDRVKEDGFYQTAYCYQDTFEISLDSGVAGGFQYFYSFFRSDIYLNKGVLLKSSGVKNGVVDLTAIQSDFDSVKGTGEPLTILELVATNSTSSDTATLPLMIKNIPDLDTAYLSISGGQVFNQDPLIPASKTFPGPWVGVNLVSPELEFQHGHYDYFKMELEELSPTGNLIRKIKFEQPFDTVYDLDTSLTALKAFNAAGRMLDPADRFENNTKRSYYRFIFHYGVKDCGEDSVSLYFRTVHPDELGLMEEGERQWLQVFPNPVNDKLSLKSSAELVEVRIFDLKGNLTKSFDNELGLEKTLSVSELSSGVYFVKVRTREGEVTRKLIKL